MSDVSMMDFHARLDRIAHIRATGGGFEAQGTLGRSYFAAPRPKPSRWAGIAAVMATGCMVFAIGIAIKLAALETIGPLEYAQKVNTMRHGNVVERVSAAVLQLDPVTQALAKRI